MIHVNDSFSARVLAFQAKWLRIPVISHCRFDVGLEQLRWTFKHVPAPQAVIFNSDALAESCGPIWKQVAPAARQYTVHNGIDLTQFPFRPVDERTEKAEFVVTLVARLVPVKGIEDFIDMAAILLQRGLPMRFRIVGGETDEAPGYRQSLESRVERAGLTSAVEFTGYQADVREFVASSDVLVCSSHVEPFGRVLIEAMACGTPVVATSVGGIPEVVEDGESGLLVPAKNPEALASAVERLFHSADLRRRLSHQGRERVCQRFSQEEHCRRVLEIYHEVLGRRLRDRAARNENTVPAQA